jgi:hypothetical protein
LSGASIVLLGGRILPEAGAQRPAEALAISGERLLAVGRRDDILAHAGSSTERVQLEGRTVLPGLIDAHLHLEQYALSLEKVDCETPTRHECLRRVRERAAVSSPGEWILGHGWNQNPWGQYGNASELDAAAPLNPVYLTAKSLHAAWANSLALQIAGIGPGTPDPEGGVLGRTASGAPSGILFERAMDLVASKVAHPPPARIETAIGEAQHRLLQAGLTMVNDFDGPRCLRALEAMRDRGQLALRVVKHLRAEELEAALALGIRTGFGDDWIRIGNLKLFADGALGPRTAAMLEPYEGDPGNTGILAMTAEEIAEIGARAAAGGIALAVHAIGDRANREALTALERLRASEGHTPGLRHRIEHVQLLHPDDVARLAASSIVASMQPIHATSDMVMADGHWGERCRTAYAWRTLLEQGTILAFGSDAPVEPPDPFLGIHAAVTRRRRDGAPGPDGWIPQQRLTVHEALAAYTLGPAHAAGLEHDAGRLAPGFLADLIVLERAIDDLGDGLADLRPVGAMVGGSWRHRKF